MTRKRKAPLRTAPITVEPNADMPNVQRQREPRQLEFFPNRPSQNKASASNRAPLAAAGDPITSHLAGEDVPRPRQPETGIACVSQSQSEALSSAAIAAAAGLDRVGVARRLPDAERDRLVERCGVRTCRVTGRPCLLWRATS